MERGAFGARGNAEVEFVIVERWMTGARRPTLTKNG